MQEGSAVSCTVGPRYLKLPPPALKGDYIFLTPLPQTWPRGLLWPMKMNRSHMRHFIPVCGVTVPSLPSALSIGKM